MKLNKQDLLQTNEILNAKIELLQESIIKRTNQSYFNQHHDILDCAYHLGTLAFKSWNSERINQANQIATTVILNLQNLEIEIEKSEMTVTTVDSKSIIAYEKFKPIFMYRVYVNNKRLSTYQFKEPKSHEQIIEHHFNVRDLLPF